MYVCFLLGLNRQRKRKKKVKIVSIRTFSISYFVVYSQEQDKNKHIRTSPFRSNGDEENIYD